ncbi:MAG: helicase-exonuclease AddAB subunit AddA [Lachnospiraceae bacterium]|nr:helicase-exonuclease AddAB subunit AddA [Lachnospiraceae bacterium]
MKYTKQQQEVIDSRNCDILISAGAGSGKTAVLTERIMGLISGDTKKTDVDRLLVLTFTRAAATQMKTRLQEKIQAWMAEHPEDEQMQIQESLLHNAMITTIDSFCLYLVRNHFTAIGIDPGFRICDPGEESLLEQEVLADVLEEAFEKGEESFLNLAASLNPNVKEQDLEKEILRLSRYASSHPWPRQWLCAMKEISPEAQAREVALMLIRHASSELSGIIRICHYLQEKVEAGAGPGAYADVFAGDIQMLEQIQKVLSEGETKDDLYEVLQQAGNLSWDRLPTVKEGSCDPEEKELLQKARNDYKEQAQAALHFFDGDGKRQQERDIMAKESADALADITITFMDRLFEKKKEKNVYGFSDIAHLALEVLLDEEHHLTSTAMEYRDYFYEIMVDEYQDSNQVQEILLSALSKAETGCHNRFMVGDKKQSIYRFRMARPDIFNEKYTQFKKPDPDHKLILLNHNFRSRQQVLDSANGIFSRIMDENVGGITFDEGEELIVGGSYPSARETVLANGEKTGYETELLLAEVPENGPAGDVAEYAMIAERIRNMVGHFPVKDERSEDPEGVRPATYRDIVILTRKYASVAADMKKVLMAAGIPVHTQERSGFYEDSAVRVLTDLLRMLQNPHQDLPLAASLKSVLFQLSDEELAQIRGKDKSCSFYECLCLAAEDESFPFAGSAKRAVALIEELRFMAGYMSVSEFLAEVIRRFHYREQILAGVAGDQKAANVDMLLQKAVDFEKTGFHGLFGFIRYLDRLERYQIDEGEAGILSEQADVVRIMSVHASKGLEFPIVFLAGCDREFNEQDKSAAMIYDLDLGLGANWTDLKNRSKGKSLKRIMMEQSISSQSKGEEIRLLYVAATRAKEKLIFTATEKGAEKNSALFFALGGAIFGKNEQAPVHLLRKARSFLDYLLLAHSMDHSVFCIKKITAENLDESRVLSNIDAGKTEDMLQSLLDWESMTQKVCSRPEEKKLYDTLRNRFSFVYPHENLRELYAKTSVSELKHAAMEEEGVHVVFETEAKRKTILPGFAGGKQAGGAERGSAYHRVLELLDFEKYADVIENMKRGEEGEKLAIANIDEDMRRFAESGRMQQEQVDLVDREKIRRFLATEEAARMSRATKKGLLLKEQPFVYMIPANRIREHFPESEGVMIQGVIDVYWEEEDGITILDYKTDRVQNEQELTERYHTQLAYYKGALEQFSQKKVKEMILYSFCLQKSVML